MKFVIGVLTLLTLAACSPKPEDCVNQPDRAGCRVAPASSQPQPAPQPYPGRPASPGSPGPVQPQPPASRYGQPMPPVQP